MFGRKITPMRPVEFGEALAAGTRLTLFSEDKPDRFLRVIKSWMEETSGIALALKTAVPPYQVEDEEGRIAGRQSLTGCGRRGGESQQGRAC
jgi:hypothetical protein